MENAKVKNTTVEIDADEYTFKLGSSKILFDGFLRVYSETEENVEELKKIPEFKEGEELKLQKINQKQHFTQPPPRFTEASLVKSLEEHGIGRPSTYAPIISKIQQKGYAEKPEKALIPTLLGKTVSEQLVKHFTTIMNYEFTASMENKLDEIAENKVVWNNIIKEFYDPFIETVAEAKEKMERVVIDSGKICPNCGKSMIVRTSRFGTQFLGCSGYPECKTMMPLNGDASDLQSEPVDEKCEKCQSEMIRKVGAYGPYLECTNQECKHRKRIIKSTGIKCPKEGCDGEIVYKKSKYGKVFFGCNKYPNCDFVSWNEPVDEKCPKCGSLLAKKITKKLNRLECINKSCDYTRDMEEEKND